MPFVLPESSTVQSPSGQVSLTTTLPAGCFDFAFALRTTPASTVTEPVAVRGPLQTTRLPIQTTSPV